jgi:DmsE family decaheme c-type cytochrome
MKRVLLCVALLASLAGRWKIGSVNAADNARNQASAAPGSGPAGNSASGYVGSDTCLACHANVAESFSTNPHSRIALMHIGAGSGCESCHGPGQAHVQSGGDVTKIFHFDKDSAKQIDGACLGCHARTHPNFMRSPHRRAGLNCISCHSIHQPGSELALLKMPQPALCFGCHTDVVGELEMPFHHPVNEGAVGCTDCHDVHGTFQSNNLRITADQNAICTQCHMDVRGPFVYEHAAVKGEGCMACHTPHGSQNARLLNMPAINVLCNQCHSQVSADTIHGMSAGSQELAPCTNCHTMIHGSNLNAAFLK